MAPTPLDPEKFLEQLKTERRVLRWEPLAPERHRKLTSEDTPRTKESVDYLHHHWTLPDEFDPTDAGAGLRGRVFGVFGRVVFQVLRRYLSEERELLSQMVQVNDALARRCDELAVHCQELADLAVDRQAAEAANFALLAAWLHADEPSFGGGVESTT